MPSAEDGDAPALEPGTAEVLQAATRVLAGVALRSLDVLDSAVTLPQFRLLAVLADLGPAPSGRAARALGLDPSTITRLADRMVAAGHVARGTDPQHRGVVTLRADRQRPRPGGGRRRVAAPRAGPDHGTARAPGAGGGNRRARAASRRGRRRLRDHRQLPGTAVSRPPASAA